MSDPKADEFDKDYWFEMYQGQCATTDEWAKKYRDEVERKADATLLARCAELQRIAEVANAMVGKERDQVEAQAKRIAELEAECERLRVDGARYGAMVEKLCNEPKKDFIVITGRQLKNALEFVAPDCPKDEDQLDTEVCIGFAPERVIDGETLPAGLMVWLAEYPEEGAIPLDDSPDAAKESA